MTHIDEETFFKEKGFGQRIGFGQRPAIVVVDFIKAFTDYRNPDLVLAANVDKQLLQTNRLIDASRLLRIPVIFTTVSYDDNLKDAGIWALKQSGLVTLRSGTDVVAVDSTLHREPGDTIIVKKYASSFFGTDLVSRLVSQQVDTVILTGCTTSGCIRATAVDAISYGFRPMIVEEAVGDRSEAAHKQSLFDLQAKYADVVSIETVLSYFQGMIP
ncbi:isochorismatase family protein [Paenibacillus validus]|uniref:isochorismatase family protein n=1 Tax=Paenibacillus TaxID=44249 RepID=UPI000FD77600|nr:MULTISPECIES: isochorismatase family protein [Paenibacillus]MED4602072.1 isochorismatase family protein [Paenibacillus validus]MED4607362.1 isochorismatase family protein [Paenibacillus validus]